jgi:hypothetical protein
MTEIKSDNSSALLKALQFFLIFQILIFFTWLIQYITDLQQHNWLAGMSGMLFYIALNALNFILLVFYTVHVRSLSTKKKSVRWDGSVKLLVVINVILVVAAFLCVDFLRSNH